MVLPSMFKVGKNGVGMIQEHLLKTPKMMFTVNIKTLLIFHVVEQSIVQNGTLLKYIPPL